MADILDAAGYRVSYVGRDPQPWFSSDSSGALVLIDISRPGDSGYALTRRLRGDPATADLPIVLIAESADLEVKLAGLDAGADDVLTPPFVPDEVLAIIEAVLRRTSLAPIRVSDQGARTSLLVAVHSLRGGTGVTSLAVNLAVSFRALWAAPTLLVDLTATGGQAAYFLGLERPRTWDGAPLRADGTLDASGLGEVTSHDAVGIDIIGSPTAVTEDTLANARDLSAALDYFRQHYDYVVFDLGHDLRFAARYVLHEADVVILTTAPELASLRSTAITLQDLHDLGRDGASTHLVMNWTFEHQGVARRDVERQLRHKVDLVLPYAPASFVPAINTGRPIVASDPGGPIGALIEDYTYRLSLQRHLRGNHEAPSPALARVLERKLSAVEAVKRRFGGRPAGGRAGERRDEAETNGGAIPDGTSV